MNVRSERFPLFDSMRALAALSVLAFHAAFFAGMYTSSSPLRPYLSHLNVGVSIFFLISGFLPYRPFVQARLAGEPLPRTGPYAWRRFLRIVPAYWVAVTLVALWLGRTATFKPEGIATYYGFAQIYGNHPAGIAQAWTLCVEVTFYAFLPLWAFAARRLFGQRWRAELIALALLWLASLAYKVYAVRQVPPSSLASGPWLQPLPNFLDQFAVGMALAVLSVRRANGAELRLFRVIDRRPEIAWVLALVAFWAVSTQIGLTGRLGQNIHGRAFIASHELYTVVALGVLLPAIFGHERRDPLRRVLALRPLLYVGLVSYALYLWHAAVVQKVASGTNGTLRHDLGFGVEARFVTYFVLAGAAAVAIATVSYYVVERPALSLKRLADRAPRAEDALAEPATAPSTR